MGNKIVFIGKLRSLYSPDGKHVVHVLLTAGPKTPPTAECSVILSITIINYNIYSYMYVYCVCIYVGT